METLETQSPEQSRIQTALSLLNSDVAEALSLISKLTDPTCDEIEAICKGLLSQNLTNGYLVSESIDLLTQLLEHDIEPDRLTAIIDILIEQSQPLYKSNITTASQAIPQQSDTYLKVIRTIVSPLIIKHSSMEFSFMQLAKLFVAAKQLMSIDVSQRLLDASIRFSEHQVKNQSPDLTFKKAPKQLIIEFCQSLQGILPKHVSDAQPRVQQVQLNLALALLNLPVLERKLTGTALLIMKVLNPSCREALVEWCAKVQIFEVFFVKSLHAELIKKSFYLLDFLHKNDRLQAAELNQMWHVATKKHEAFRQAIFKSLTFLAGKCLTIEQMHGLFVKIKAMQNKEHDRASIGLLKAIAVKLNPQEKPLNFLFDNNKNQQFKGFLEAASATNRNLLKERRPRSLSETAQQDGEDASKKPRLQSPNARPNQLSPVNNQRPQVNNPFEVPIDKQDKNTADDELSPKHGVDPLADDDQDFDDYQADFQQKQEPAPKHEPKEEECKHPDLIPQHYLPVQLRANCQNQAATPLAEQVLALMWQLSLDESVEPNIAAQGSSIISANPGLKQSQLTCALHQLCIEQLTEVICQNYQQTWFFFIQKAISFLRVNKYSLTMQSIIRKLLSQLQFPMVQNGREIPDVPKDRLTMIRALDRQFEITHVCIQSYVDFKRQCLQIINAHNFDQQEDDIETQSSLDDDDIVESQNANTIEVDRTPANPEQKQIQIATNLPDEESKQPPQQRVREQQQVIGTRSFLDTLITNKVYQYTFFKEISERLSFLKTLIIQCPEHLLKSSQLQLLWEILVQNAFYEKERDLFFTWCTEILKAAQSRQNQLLLQAGYSRHVQELDVFSDDCLELLFFETLLKLDFKTFTQAMLSCFWEFFLHVNAQYGQIETLALDNFKVHTHKLIGIEALFEIVFTSTCEQVHQNSQTLLTKLFQRCCELTNEIKMWVLNTCVAQIRQGLGDDQPIKIARCVRVLSRFISEFEFGKKAVKVESYDIRLNINNSVSGTQGPTKLELTVTSNTTVREVLDKCSSQIFPQRAVNELNLVHKGKDLKEHLKTLKEISKEPLIIMILTSKSEIELEYEQMQAFAQKPDDSEQLKEAISNLKEFLGETTVTDAVIGLALQKCNYDLGEAIDMVTDEDQVANLEAQVGFEEVIPLEAPAQQVQEEDDVSLNFILSNDSNYFDFLFNLLNQGQREITEAVWSLLTQIPVNKTLLQSIKSLDSIYTPQKSDALDMAEEPQFFGWEQIVDPTQTYKMLYSLQLLNQMISVNSEQLQEPEMHERVSWRLRFLELGGFNHLYQLLLTSEIEKQPVPSDGQGKKTRKAKRRAKSNINQVASQARDDQARCQSLLISLIQVFISAALLGIDENRNLQQLIYNSSTSPFRKTQAKANKSDELVFQLSEQQSDDNHSSNDKSSQNTPTFNRSFSSSQPVVETAQHTQQQQKSLSSKKTLVDDFPRLIQQMKDKVATQILFSVVQLPEFLKKLLQVSQHTLGQHKDACKEKIPQEASELIQRCLDTILPLLVWQPEVITDCESLEYILEVGLQSSCEAVRACVERFFRVCSQNSAVPGLSLRVLNKLYSRLEKSQELHYEYFQLLAFTSTCNPTAFSQSPEASLDHSLSVNGLFQIDRILALLIKMITDPKTEDVQLAGYFKLTQSLVELQPQYKNSCREKYNLPTFLYDAMFKAEAPKRSKVTRKRCMELMKVLALGNHPNFMEILARMDIFQKEIKDVLSKQDLQEYLASQGQSRAAIGYVGLKNFGSTCYMNSLIQQLYMVKDFSNYLVDFEEPISDSVVIELRKIFANLQESQKLAYAPAGFTQVFQLERGQQINVRQQQDTHDFFSVLVDNIENCHPHLKSMIQKQFGGTICNELKSLEQDYPYLSHREEPFYCLSLDIKGKQSLEEALDFYIQPDVLEGENKYQCDKYGVKIDAQRRQFLCEMQNTVVINLKRFEFDYNQMQHVKINDWCAFPEQIDFRKWTQAGIDSENEEQAASEAGGRYSSAHEIDDESSGVSDGNQEELLGGNSSFDNLIDSDEKRESRRKKKPSCEEGEFKYQLAGVLVHSGSANSGHYYSYIRERDGSQRWLEFNDTLVKEFDFAQLAEKCYGQKGQAPQPQWGQFHFESSANAYLLFYERVKPKPASASEPLPTPVQPASDYSISLPKAQLIQDIRQENDAFTKMNNFLDFDYFQFVWDFVSIGKTLFKPATAHPSDSVACLQFAARFVFDMIQKVKDAGVFLQWMPLVDQLFAENLPAAQWLSKYLAQNPILLQGILMDHTNGEVREQFCTLLKTIIRVQCHQAQQDEQQSAYEDCDQMILTLRNINFNKKLAMPKKNDEYFDVLNEYLNTRGSQHGLPVLAESTFLENLVDYVGESSSKQSDATYLSYPLDLLTRLIKQSPQPPLIELPLALADPSNFTCQVLRSLMECMTTSPLLLQECCDSLYTLLTNLQYKSEAHTDKLIKAVQGQVSTRPSLRVFESFLRKLKRALQGLWGIVDHEESSDEQESGSAFGLIQSQQANLPVDDELGAANNILMDPDFF